MAIPETPPQPSPDRELAPLEVLLCEDHMEHICLASQVERVDSQGEGERRKGSDPRGASLEQEKENEEKEVG